MKREPDYIIEFLKECEESEDSWIIAGRDNGMTETEKRRVHHLEIMSDVGLVAEVDEGGNIFRITNSGHDFLEASRNPKVWQEVKGWIKEGMPLATAAAKIASLF